MSHLPFSLVRAWSFLLVAAVVWPVAANAQTKAERHAAANQLVAEALHREVYGDANDRQELLREALAHEPIHLKLHRRILGSCY